MYLRYCTVEQRHKASRGLSAIAELLALKVLRIELYIELLVTMGVTTNVLSPVRALVANSHRRKR